MASGLLFVRTKREGQVSQLATFPRFCTLVFALIACGGCSSGGGGDSTPPVQNQSAPTVAHISLTPPAPSIKLGLHKQFVATAMDGNGNPVPGVTTFTWTSSNPAVASINSTGLATGQSGGSTMITASAGGVTSSGVQLQVITAGYLYSTNFSQDENPISDSGDWTCGLVAGVEITCPQTVSGKAYGTQDPDPPSNQLDSIAQVNGTWTTNQTVTETVFITPQAQGLPQREIEIFLNLTINAGNPGTVTGYEFDFLTNGVLIIFRWDGPLRPFLDPIKISDDIPLPGGALKTGDVLKATNTNGILQAYVNDVPVATVSDNTFTGGHPGWGWFASVGYGGQNSDWGITTFTASD